MATGDATKVRFDLWAVLGFLVVLFGIGMGYLFSAQAINREERQAAIQKMGDRVTTLEVNYTHIMAGIKDLKESLLIHESVTIRAMQKQRQSE